ncbi:MAG: hypothetical protein KIH01_04885 [Candidatus Freyarchaeota archaeon]|nr:hypothetical protein [Candidatus Jordarchaeia archaeon]
MLRRFFGEVLASRTVRPSFREGDVLGVLLLLAEEPVGRYAVRDVLGLGDAAVRTMLRRLQRLGLIRPAGRKGHVLTDKGRLVAEKLMGYVAEFRRLPKSFLSVGECDYGFRIRGMSHLISGGVEERDIAVSGGGRGATTIIVKSGRLVVPSVKELDGEEEAFLRRFFELEEGDVVLIVSAEDCPSALRAGLSVAASLIKRAETEGSG